MALDFSDITGKKKPVAPQQNNAQEFYSPDKIPETTQLKPSGMGYPVQQTQGGDELMPVSYTHLTLPTKRIV